QENLPARHEFLLSIRPLNSVSVRRRTRVADVNDPLPTPVRLLLPYGAVFSIVGGHLPVGPGGPILVIAECVPKITGTSDVSGKRFPSQRRLGRQTFELLADRHSADSRVLSDRHHCRVLRSVSGERFTGPSRLRRPRKFRVDPHELGFLPLAIAVRGG